MRFVALLTIFILSLSTSASAEVDLVKVDKSEHTMYLLDGDKVVKEFHIALGAYPQGHKMQEGDERTPEGTYVLDFKKEDSAYHRAMHISYPNRQDRANARRKGANPGGAIMIHGQRNGFGWLAFITQRFDWTDGCIALTNGDMDTFMQLVPVGTNIRIQW